ncbi:hypothetical protein Bpfe_017571 [Biomphalaria pfeifferi]|uniref:Uncharacterized protein n=1 Tax=Biomphalaria pfeifferi TaxID=112525 RepID=A0AAD8F7K4_BIOPF|nr:hypothetical protein Bpfe_017571 [Biomphalaria pfeifferi]
MCERIFQKDRSSLLSNSQLTNTKIKTSHKIGHKKVYILDRGQTITTLQSQPYLEQTGCRLNTEHKKLYKEQTKSSVSEIKDLRKFKYSCFGQSSDLVLRSKQETGRPDPYADTPKCYVRLNKDDVTRRCRGRHRNDFGGSKRAGRDENTCNVVCVGADTDEDDGAGVDDEETGGAPQAVRAMQQTNSEVSSKIIIDPHKQRMEEFARRVPSKHLVKHLSCEGYFNFTYARFARTNCLDQIPKCLCLAPKIGKKKMAKKTGQHVV